MGIKSILIVDDSESDQFLCKRIIQKYNADIEILQAYNGEEALELLRTTGERPSLILLDINMPKMNGHEFLEAYKKELGEETKVVLMLTTSDNPEDKEKALAYDNVKIYFTKSLTELDLEKAEALLD